MYLSIFVYKYGRSYLHEFKFLCFCAILILFTKTKAAMISEIDCPKFPKLLLRLLTFVDGNAAQRVGAP